MGVGVTCALSDTDTPVFASVGTFTAVSVCLTTGAAVTVTIASVELELWNPLTPWNVAETRAVPAVKKVCGSRAVPSAPGVTGVPTSAPSTLN